MCIDLHGAFTHCNPTLSSSQTPCISLILFQLSKADIVSTYFIDDRGLLMVTLLYTPPLELTVFVDKEECAGLNLSFLPEADFITHSAVALRS